MNTRPFFAVLAFLLSTTLSRATDFTVPQQKIVGADKPIALGELATLSVSPPDKVANLASTNYSWKIFDGNEEKRFAVDADGKVFFGAGIKPKKLLAIVAITHVFIVKDGEQIKEVATKTVMLNVPVVIGDGQPTPDEPTPQPKPDPAPKFPDGKYQLSLLVWQTARDKVNPSGRPEAAKALAESFRNIAQAISSGSLKDAASILKETKKSNDAALGQNSSAWDQFGATLQDRLLQLYQAGSLKYPADFAQAWAEIIAGLEAVK